MSNFFKIPWIPAPAMANYELNEPLPPGHVKLSFDRAELLNLKSAALQGRAYAERISATFALRLIQAFNASSDYYAILDEVDYLEGLRLHSNTKPAAPFKRGVLKPFWHKHFSSARHLVRNVGVRWALDKRGNSDLRRLLNDVAERNLGKRIGVLCHELVIGGYASRAQEMRLTGDWIIFSKWRGENFYIDIASHEEGRNDAVLLQKLRYGSEAEFPFLFDK